MFVSTEPCKPIPMELQHYNKTIYSSTLSVE